MSKETAHVKEVKKVGDYYVVKGSVDGRDTSVHVPAPSVEERSRKEAHGLFERGLRRSAESEQR